MKRVIRAAVTVFMLELLALTSSVSLSPESQLSGKYTIDKSGNIQLTLDIGGAIAPGKGTVVGKDKPPYDCKTSSLGKSFIKEALDAHNEFRTRHRVENATLDAKMTRAAQDYAHQIACLGRLEHSSREEREGDGENLAFSCSSSGKTLSGKQAVINWYNEVCKPGYNFDEEKKASSGTGHFSQVVWKESKLLGIGSAVTRTANNWTCTYVVGRYRTPGNFVGDYKDNVFKGDFDRKNDCKNIN